MSGTKREVGVGGAGGGIGRGERDGKAEEREGSRDMEEGESDTQLIIRYSFHS